MSFNFNQIDTEPNTDIMPLSVYWHAFKKLLADRHYFYKIFKPIKNEIYSRCQYLYNSYIEVASAYSQKLKDINEINNDVYGAELKAFRQIVDNILSQCIQTTTFNITTFHKPVSITLGYYIYIPCGKTKKLNFHDPKIRKELKTYDLLTIIHINCGYITIKDGKRRYVKHLSESSLRFLNNYMSDYHISYSKKFIR